MIYLFVALIIKGGPELINRELNPLAYDRRVFVCRLLFNSIFEIWQMVFKGRLIPFIPLLLHRHDV